MKKNILLAIIIFSLFISISTSYTYALSNEKGYNTTILFFWSEGCPHCAQAKPFLKELAKNDWVHLESFEVSRNATNRELWQSIMEAYNSRPVGVPTIIIGDKVFVGFAEGEGLVYSDTYKAYIGYDKAILNTINTCHLEGCIDPWLMLKESDNSSILINQTNGSSINNSSIKLWGKELTHMSLPLLTVFVAFLDGFNPCAMWVLSFLLTLLVYTHSRKKMLIVGLIFVFTSAIMYFLFMAAWLNFFLLVGYVTILRILVGVIAVIAGIINLKDAFFFKKGVSLTISESGKKKLVKKMRKVTTASTMIGMIIGTIVLAVTANAMEGLCTAGLPAIYTRILTLHNLPPFTYYSYLALYNLIYVIPYLVIVLIFVATLGRKKLTVKEGKILKLINSV